MTGSHVAMWWMRAIVAVMLLVSPTGAQPKTVSNVEGVVMTVQGADVIVDIGEEAGLRPGDRLELWRPIEIMHPVTRKRLRDRYRVGVLVLGQVRKRMSIGTVEGRLDRPPASGDPVIWRRVPEPPPAPRPVPPPPPAAASPAPTPAAAATPAAAQVTDVEAQKVTALIEGLKDASLEDRIRAYVAYIRENPQSPYAALVREDAVQYHRMLRASREAPQRAEIRTPRVVSRPSPPVLEALFSAPETALAGTRLELAVQVEGPASGAVLHVRSPGQVGYRSAAMKPAGPGFYRGEIRGDQMIAPVVEYFVEATDDEGKATAVVGTEDAPLRLQVESTSDVAPKKLQELTTVSLLTDYANFNRLRDNDWTWQTQGTLGMRFRDVGFRALRTGFGVFRGKGGSIDDLDVQKLTPRAVGLTYGYLEGEFAFARITALVLRAVTGLTEEGITGGVLGLIRIGDDQGTNLALGGEFLGGVGMRSIAQLELEPVHRVPVLLRSEVTNQPAGTAPTSSPPGRAQERGDLGLRGIVQIGYEIFPRFVIAVRGSYQGRTIWHAGPGVGGAVSTSW